MRSTTKEGRFNISVTTASTINFVLRRRIESELPSGMGHILSALKKPQLWLDMEGFQRKQYGGQRTLFVVFSGEKVRGIQTMILRLWPRMFGNLRYS